MPPPWLTLLVSVALVLVPAHIALGGVIRNAAYGLATALALVAVLVARRRAAPRHRDALAWMAAAISMAVVAEIGWTLWEPVSGAPPPDSSVLDLFSLAFYPLFAIGLALIIRGSGRARRDWENVLDATIVGVGATAVVWQFVVVPELSGPGPLTDRLVLAAYPALSVVMAGLVVRLGLRQRAGSVPAVLLIGSAGAALAADLSHTLLATDESRAVEHLVDALWMLQYTALAAALLHPAFGTLLDDDARRAPLPARPRLVLLALASLVTPVVAAFVSGGRALVPIGASALLAVLVMTRVWFMVREITESGERRLLNLVRNANDMVVVFDRDGHPLTLNPRAAEVWDAVRSSTDPTLMAAVHPEDRPSARAAFSHALAAGGRGVAEAEVRLLQADGTFRSMLVRLTNLLDDPDVGGMVANVQDVHDLRRLASFDVLTGLPNRSRFTDRIEAALDTRGGATVLLVDLDRFKEVNDALGHAAGDQVLQGVSERLAALMGPGELVARLGGDEFGVVLAYDEAHGTDVAERLLHEARQPVSLDGLAVSVGASVGIAHAPPGSLLATGDLLRRADLALYAAKERGRSCWVTYDPAMGRRAMERMALRTTIAHALERNEFDLHFQPVVALASGGVVGFEAFARWNHPTLGVIPPAEFISAAEDSSHILAVGQWVLAQALGHLGHWRSDHPALDLYVSVNLSPRQLLVEAFADEVRQAVDIAGVPARSLVLEVTEEGVVEHLGVALDVLHDLRTLGVRLALDEFGTGPASIGHLTKLPIELLKLDRSLIGSLAREQSSPAIVHALNEMADALGLTTIATGIETGEQLRLAMELGCIQGQGYLLGAPSDAVTAGRRIPLAGGGFVGGDHTVLRSPSAI